MDAFLKLMQTRKGKREGWERFCKRLGVTPDAIAAPFTDNVAWSTGAAEAVFETLQEDEPNGITETVAARELQALLAAFG